ncbi:trypsin-like serine peptidase [Streptomyces antibioticus]|uniref:trypsin-like serine peptidase n=1 Tax=Streptomyces antibioticus TaxID=1890 RepID=UPI0036FEA5E6
MLALGTGLVACEDAGKNLPAFSNPVIPGLWTPSRMAEAHSADLGVPRDLGADAAVSDAEPAPVDAEAEETPYSRSAPVLGKVFFDTPQGPSVCSGTAVEDPNRPGSSGLVWTAGHCVHSGAGGEWYRNIVFVPSYNDDGLDAQALADAPEARVAPFGTWWADRAETSREWIERGQASGGDGASFDYAVLHVRTPKDRTAALEKTIGQAAPVWFDAPSIVDTPLVRAWGYPAAQPFDGAKLLSCQDEPTRLSIDTDEPTMYRIGCTMTGGSSGGGWFARRADGTIALVSNTSIGPAENTWLAGPRLDASAKAVLDAVSARV